MCADFTPYEDASEKDRIFLEEFFIHYSFDEYSPFASSENFGPELEYGTIPQDWRVRYEPVLAGMRVYVTGTTSCPARPDRPGFEASFSFCCEETVDRLGDIDRKPKFLMSEDCDIQVKVDLTVYPSESEAPIQMSLSLGKEYVGKPGRKYSRAPGWLGSLYFFVYDTGIIRYNAWLPLDCWRNGEFNKHLEHLSKKLRLKFLGQFPHVHGDWLSEPLPSPYVDYSGISLQDQIAALDELKTELESLLLNQTPDNPAE